MLQESQHEARQLFHFALPDPHLRTRAEEGTNAELLDVIIAGQTAYNDFSFLVAFVIRRNNLLDCCHVSRDTVLQWMALLSEGHK